jgi:hypothetical protein
LNAVTAQVDRRLLQKPFRIETLGRILEQVLAAPPYPAGLRAIYSQTV